MEKGRSQAALFQLLHEYVIPSVISIKVVYMRNAGMPCCRNR